MTDDELSKLLADTTTPDMISREDAIRALTEVAVRFGITGEPQIMIVAKEAIRAIPTAPAPAVDVAWAAQLIVDNVLDQPSERAVKLRTQMIDATMAVRCPSVSRWRRWSMVNEAIRRLAASGGDA